MIFLITGRVADWIVLQITSWGGEVVYKYRRGVTHVVVGEDADVELLNRLLFKPICRVSESQIDDFFERLSSPAPELRRIIPDFKRLESSI